ncbi:MAG: peptidoglycan DD-metalloendopeptidase family protein [Microgenomates group bacterium]
MDDLGLFVSFLKKYFLDRIIRAGLLFESFKDLVVALLIIKRGKYSSTFLNGLLLMVVAVALVFGPVIAQNSPFIAQVEQQSSYQNSIIAYNPYESTVSTVVSVKPEIIDYQVQSGDSLASIAKKFNLSVDSIKWSNGLKSDLIKPGQVLKIPPFDGVIHKVEPGETVYSIAKKYHVNAQNIVNYTLNDFVDQETFSLASGQLLFVPGGKIIPEAPKSPSVFIASIQAGARGSSNFIWPTSGVITQYPVIYHMALDIANPQAPPIITADSGIVSYAGCLSWGYGCHVIINHNNGYQTLYAHLSRYDVSVGEKVSQGQQIGIMGSTGRSTGTHLHFEIRAGNQLLNPLNFLK